MQEENERVIIVQNHLVDSICLKREVKVDFYMPTHVEQPHGMSLLLINDGQDLPVMNFRKILSNLSGTASIRPLLCVGIHCSNDRRNEYGTASMLDYKGYGTTAKPYQDFVLRELLPFIREKTFVPDFKDKSYCGFSLGALSALDIVWGHPEEFKYAGMFSGSFWWRMMGQDEQGFDESKHRIMHNLIKAGGYYPWLKFFFETGTLDEVADRNNNGVIDAIDDTISLIYELVAKGYDQETAIRYLQLEDGKHDVPTWGRAFPAFLKWAFAPLTPSGAGG